jgi:mRNA-degrading endonuclease HigB of HigAB toxin-antitoxin module
MEKSLNNAMLQAENALNSENKILTVFDLKNVWQDEDNYPVFLLEKEQSEDEKYIGDWILPLDLKQCFKENMSTYGKDWVCFTIRPTEEEILSHVWED